MFYKSEAKHLASHLYRIMSKTALIQQVYGYFGQGNIPGIIELLHPNVVFDAPYKESPMVPRGIYKGKEGVLQYFQDIANNLDIQAFEPCQFVEQGNTVVVLGYVKSKVKATGKFYETEWVMVWTVVDNQITAWKDFQDTYAGYKAHTPYIIILCVGYFYFEIMY